MGSVHPLFGDSPVPRYAQLADVLRGRIARGVLKRGDQLPTLEALMQEFDVARVTVRQAIELLSREGLLSAQQGRGTFVIAAPSSGRLHLQTRLKTCIRSVETGLCRIFLGTKTLATGIALLTSSP